MPTPVVTNFATTTLAEDILTTSTEITVAENTGAFFPEPAADEYAVLVIEDVSGDKEIVHLTSRATDVLTVVRARESTAAKAYLAGSRIECRVTAGFLDQFVDGGEF